LAIAYGSAVETGELIRLLAEAEIVQRAGVAEAEQRNARCQRLILGLLKPRRTLRR